MSKLPLASLLLLCCLTACNKPKPSPEYAQALELHARLYGEKLDDAYLDPRMAEAEALLQQVGKDSLDYRAAQELGRKISGERERLLAEEEARQKAVAEALAQPPLAPELAMESPPGQEVSPESEQPDAGSPQPVRGMALSEFQSRFSGCFSAWDPVEVGGRGTMQSYELKDIARCRDQHPDFLDKLVLVEGEKLYEPIRRSALKAEWRPADGGGADAGR